LSAASAKSRPPIEPARYARQIGTSPAPATSTAAERVVESSRFVKTASAKNCIRSKPLKIVPMKDDTSSQKSANPMITRASYGPPRSTRASATANEIAKPAPPSAVSRTSPLANNSDTRSRFRATSRTKALSRPQLAKIRKSGMKEIAKVKWPNSSAPSARATMTKKTRPAPLPATSARSIHSALPAERRRLGSAGVAPSLATRTG
jgi:hypothetical protein